MSNPPPGLGGSGGGIAGNVGMNMNLRGNSGGPAPPPGFGGSPSSTAGSGGKGGSSGGGGGSGGGSGGSDPGGTAVIVRAQIVFLLTTITEESFEKASNEIRSLVSTNGPEMYHHFLRRAAIVANPILQTLIQHSSQYQDDPAAPPPNIPTSGQAALVWRLLCNEALRASRDIHLAPHFAMIMLTPFQSTPLPVPSLRLFNLPPVYLFFLSAYSLATPQTFSSSQNALNILHNLIRQTFTATMTTLRSPSRKPFWSTVEEPDPNAPGDDLTLQEARTLILALYPRSSTSSSSGENPSRPATPTNPTSPHPSSISSIQRAQVLASLSAKFGNVAIVLQTLSALSPGGPPRSPDSIPLEDMLFELGDLTQEPATVESVIGRWWGPYLLDLDSPDRNELLTQEVGRTLLGLFRGIHERRSVDWSGVLKALTSLDGVNWSDVVRSFDIPQSPATYSASVPFLLSILTLHTPDLPIEGILPSDPDTPIWNNLDTLIHILNTLSSIAPDHFKPFGIPNSQSSIAYPRVVDPPSDESKMSNTARRQALEAQNGGIWNAFPFIKTLVEILRITESLPQSQKEELASVTRGAEVILDKALEVCPDFLLIAFDRLPKPLPAPLPNVHRTLLSMFLSSSPASLASSQLVFHTLNKSNPEALAEELHEFYQASSKNLGRIYEIVHEVNILGQVLDSEDRHYALDVATYAASKGALALDNMLATGIEVKGHEYLESLFDFTEHKIRVEMEHLHQPPDVPKPMYTLSPDIFSTIIRVIRNADDLAPEDISRFRRLRTDILIMHPVLLNVQPNSKEEQGFSVVKFPAHIREDVDRMYDKMYDGGIPLDEIISELKKMSQSDDRNDQRTFGCALHTLFDEYPHITNYPNRQLATMGILFGALIDYKLVKDIPAFVVTRYVLDSCKSPPGGPVYQFGINALSILRPSLVDYPGLCRSLLEIPALHESHPVLINDIVAALAEREDLDQQGGVKLAFPALKLPVLIEEGDDEFREPDARKKDSIMFIINQIAPSNHEQKSKDLVEQFEDQYSRWFAHYFIDVRVSLEANRHDIYMQLLEAINSPVLERHILWETYRKARDLLNAETTVTSAAERSTLKSVALWLGRITLARNIPIKLRELSIKDLLIQGYDNKRLLVAIAFVCNLLVSCADSKVFHLPNPWLKSIISLLAEFYHYAELRIQPKFEIDLLFSKLNINLADIEESNMLRTHNPPPPPQEEVPDRLAQELERALAEFDSGRERFEQPPVDPAFARMQQYQNEAAAQAAQDAFMRHVDELVATLPEHLTFSPEYPIFTAPTLQRVVHHSIDRAIRDIVQPVVERSVTIAGISSRDLVQKDFGMEGDASKMRHSAHNMVQNLAGNLAIVTCKEPLRSSMMNNIRTMLSQNGFTEENMPEGMIIGVVNDNIEAGCAVIRKAAMEKAIKDIDVNLAPQYAARRAHREAGSRQPFYDGASFGVALSTAALPDALRLHSRGLTQGQLRVYEDFGEPTRIFPASQPGHTTNGAAAGYPPPHAHPQSLGLPDHTLRRGTSPLYPDQPHPSSTQAQAPSLAQGQGQSGQGGQGQGQGRPFSPRTAIDKFHELTADIDRFIAQSNYSTVSQLPPDSELRQIVQTIVYFASQSANKEGSTLVIAQKVVQYLYKATSVFGREVYTVLLQQLCGIAKKVDKEVKHWLIFAEDSRKLNVPVIVTLLRSGFLNVKDMDKQLAKSINSSHNPEMMDFVADLVRECSLSNEDIIPRTGFAASLAALLRAHEMERSTPAVDNLLEDLRRPRQANRDAEPSQDHIDAKSAITQPPIDVDMQERLAHFFLEWVRVYSTNISPEVSFVPYITFLQKEGILNGEDVSSAFYRTAINCAVDLDSGKLDSSMEFHGTDSLAKLIVLIIKNYGDKSSSSSVNRAVYYYNKIITIMSYSLIQRQLEDSFSQRPWTRFFSSMLSELSVLRYSLPETYFGCLKSFANVLGITQPIYAPKFAYGWMSLVSHRFFMPELLSAPEDQGWGEYHRCIMWLLRFLEGPFKGEEMTPASRYIYQATIRLLLVLLHDFPEFLEENYHTLSTAIPFNCVQLRNIILSAFPDSVKPLPDVYTPLNELTMAMQRFPTVRTDYTKALLSGNVKAAIDQHVRNGGQTPPLQAIVSELKNRIAVKTMGQTGEPVITWNHTLLHAVVFYLGTTAVGRRAQQVGQAEFDPKAPEVGILTNLAYALDDQGQYNMFSVIADQLRYPSAHTLFYIHLMLFLFATSTRTEMANTVPEHICRVLLERVIVQRPHPWGLVVTFVELLNNESYGFWKQPFVRADEEIFMLFANSQRNFARSNRGSVDGRQSGGAQGQGAIGAAVGGQGGSNIGVGAGGGT